MTAAAPIGDHGAALDRVLAALAAHGTTPRHVGREYVARCPAHADRTPSLAVAQGELGAVLVCRAGCRPRPVVDALGLRLADLYDAPSCRAERTRERRAAHGRALVVRATPIGDHGTEIREQLDGLYPGSLALLLLPVCAPDPHQHDGAACTKPGKRARGGAWNREAIERWRSGVGRDDHLDTLARHVARGGNIGWAVPPGVLVLDADTAQAVAWLDRALPDAPMQESREGHAHFVVRVAADLAIGARVRVEIADGIEIDLRSAGRSQIVVEPSRHASGSLYTWLRQLPADLGDLPECPALILARVTTPQAQRAASGGRGVSAGGRNDYLYRVGCGMRARGLSGPEIADELHAENARRCDPPLDPGEVDAIVASVMRHAAGVAQEREHAHAERVEQARGMADADDEAAAFPTTDKSNALRISTHYGDELRWCAALGWLAWTGERWEPSETRALRVASRLGRLIRREAAELAERAAAADTDARAKLDAAHKALLNWARDSEQARHVRDALTLARVYLEIPLDALDADPWGLNCVNGTVDLRTGELRPHRRSDYLTRTTGITYDADAASELWDRVLATALPDASVREFVARAAGYTALGRKGEDVLLLIYGPTRTAKGTVQSAIATALGEYAATAGLEALAKRDKGADGSRARPELARLRGARMVSIYETGRALRLDDALVKSLAGSDPITARQLYTAEFTFAPTFAIWIAANHRPRLADDDDALWERLREIPFETQIARGERDPEVRRRLSDPTDGGPAVLRWVVEGALAYQRDGLAPPDRVTAATANYRASMDRLSPFLAACCVLAPDAWTPSAELRAAYDAWCRESGERALGGSEFDGALRRHGCTALRRHAGRGWLGVGIATDEGA